MESLQPFFEHIEYLLYAAKLNIRETCKKFYIEAYKWLG